MSAESTVPKEIVHTNEDFFKKIGDAVETVDKTKDAGDDDDEPQVVDRIESLCMNCHENGETKLLLTRIPFFKEVILMSFYCEHCHFRNNEIQSAGMIQERGVKFIFRVSNKDDMNRQIVKSDNCTCRIEELDLEVPAQRGQLTTVEGLLRTVHDDLALAQEQRKDVDPEGYEQVEKFLATLIQYVNGEKFPITLIVDDPSGNSWVEPNPEDPRGKWTRSQYLRSKEQNEFLALAAPGEGEADQPQEPVDVDIAPDEVYTFPATCPSCVKHCETHMKTVDIPHFKDVIIMATNCDHCGYKSNEVKTGGAVPSKGRRITLKVQDEEDLARDILKSETCALTCPELNLDLTPGTLGGRFTTVEGLLSQVHDELHERVFSEMSGDSIEPERKQRWINFFDGLKEAKEGKREFTLILEDPLAASYLQNLYAPDPDPNMVTEDYERTHEQEEDLGLLDMKTEGYEEQEAIDQAERDAKAKKLAESEMEETKRKAEKMMEANAQKGQ